MSNPSISQRRARWLAVSALVLIVVLVFAAAWFLPDGAWEKWIMSVPAPVLICALVVLPLTGFPVTALHLAAGARFGIVGGLALVALSIVLHLAASLALARWADRPVRWMMRMCGWKMPVLHSDSAWPFSLWLALLPGVSYAFKNLVAPMVGVPAKVYVGAFFPIHLASSLVGLALGGATVHFSWGSVTFALVYTIALIVLTRMLVRRVRMKSSPVPESDAITALPSANR
jgi:uncharacterized membrane protein YdjX (TVP38/TMEM64 family)